MGAARAQFAQLGVSGGEAAITAVGDDRDLLSIAAEVGDERSQVRSHPFSVAQEAASRIPLRTLDAAAVETDGALRKSGTRRVK